MEASVACPREPITPEMAERLTELYRAFADPTRVRIISLLIQGEMGVGDIATSLDMSISAVSHQLGLLRLLKVVAARRSGRQVLYRLDDEHVTLVYTLGAEHVLHS